MRAFLEAAVWRQLAVFLVALAIPVVVYAECEATNEPPYYPPAPQVAVVDGYVEGTDLLVSGTGLTAGSHSVMAQASDGSREFLGPFTTDAVPDSAGNLPPQNVAIPLTGVFIGLVYLWLVNDVTGVASDVATLTLSKAAVKEQCVPPFRGGLYKDYKPTRAGCHNHHMPSVWSWQQVNATAGTSYRYNCTPVVEMLIPDHMQTSSYGRGAAKDLFRRRERDLILSSSGLQFGFANAFQLAADDVKSINAGAGAAKYGAGIEQARAAMNARVPAGGTISC